MSKSIFNPVAIFSSLISIVLSCSSGPGQPEVSVNADSLATVLEESLKKHIFGAWFPLVIDSADGGYFSNLTSDMKVAENQPKMIVSQGRHVWTASQAAAFLNDPAYEGYAGHGVKFLIEHMWDKEYGGFYNLRTKSGGSPGGPSADDKRAYGNAFAIYGLSSYYNLTGDTIALNYARKAFRWLDEHSRDKENGGYIDRMNRMGTWLSRTGAGMGQNRRTSRVAWKDFNSSIHLLEAFTELYIAWPDELVRERLNEMMHLVRDTFTTPKGYLTLFFTEDWTPVSNRDSGNLVIRQRSGMDHISFGHDIETAFLLLEASHALGIENDTTTLRIAKKLVDHTLENGFDKKSGGLFDAGYYFPGNDTVTILNESADWWVQSEAMNSLLLMSAVFPDEPRYMKAFLEIWKHIDAYLIDKEHGEWYIKGLYYNPEAKNAPKGSIWKTGYHNSRAMMNCIRILRDEYELARHFAAPGTFLRLD